MTEREMMRVPEGRAMVLAIREEAKHSKEIARMSRKMAIQAQHVIDNIRIKAITKAVIG